MTTVAQALDLALEHHRAGGLQQAEQLYWQILQVEPRHVDALHLLGVLAHQTGRNDLAIAYIGKAIAQNANRAPFHSNLGAAYQALGKLSEAEACYRQALQLQPAYAQAHNNLGLALLDQGKLDEAEASFRRAVGLKPDYVEAYNNLGSTLHWLGRLGEAVKHYQHALHLDPRDAEAHKNLAQTWLLLGNFEQGWPEYEWRWKCKDFSLPLFRQPRWDGSPLQGRTILLHAEQGLGDTMHFVRYAALIKQQGGNVLVQCPRQLLPLLGSCHGIYRLAAQGSGLAESYDVYAPLMSLPGILGTSLASVPAQVPYLFADPQLIDHWRQEMSRLSEFKIGICWDADARFRRLNRQRCIPLSQFAPLGRLAGVRLISLQKGPGLEQLRTLAGLFPVTDLGRRLDEESGAFMDTAAIMKSLDLVVTADTSIAHLAGALGVPVWVALPFAPDWRWLLHREDSPWYPTMRLYRQSEPGAWQPIFERMAGEVQQLLTTTPARSTALRTASVERCGDGEPIGSPQDLCFQPELAVAHYNQGNTLVEQGRHDEGAACYRQALRCKPDYVEAHNNLGSVLAGQGNLAEAATSFRQALRFKPNTAGIHNNLGNVLAKQRKPAEAVACYQQALHLKPDFVEARYNMGNALREQGKLEEAVACYHHALRLKPDFAGAHGDLGMAWLLLGHLERGWPEYEWCWKCKQQSPLHGQSIPPGIRVLPYSTWDGSPLNGRTILLFAEQSWGDTLQFIRYAKLVKEKGATVVLACPKSRAPLLASCPGVDRLIPEGSPGPPFDVHASLMGLPGILGTKLETIPAEVPYLFANAALTARWHEELSLVPAFKIGIAWQGNPKHERPGLGQRSIPLTQFAPLARLAGVRLISLQKGLGTEQLLTVADMFTVTDLGSQLDEVSGAFMDTAAVMKSLDLVVTCDTSVAHLAGALGLPVWVALPFAPDWRWLLHREDSPWYPTVRLFRQSQPGNWQAVFQRIAGEVRKLLQRSVEGLR
jgi:tetratricopeptide (TPR) repeat protein/ADP-heptose:LPS heptosyltransferase